MRVTYMISLNHDVPAQSITKLHAYKFAAYPRNPAQTRTFPRNATRKFGLGGPSTTRGINRSCSRWRIAIASALSWSVSRIAAPTEAWICTGELLFVIAAHIDVLTLRARGWGRRRGIRASLTSAPPR